MHNNSKACPRAKKQTTQEMLQNGLPINPLHMTKFKLKVSVWILILAAYYSWVGTKTKTVKILQQKVGLAIFKSYSRATAILERVSRATGWLGFWRVSLPLAKVEAFRLVSLWWDCCGTGDRGPRERCCSQSVE